MNKSAAIATMFAAASIALAPIAMADPPSPHSGDPNLCASNPAYHNAHDDNNKDKHCKDTALNDFGGGGGMDKTDTDGDGQPDVRDHNPTDPTQK